MAINKRRFSQIACRLSQIKHLRKSALDLRISALNNLKNKRILITAGPTWVAIDSVRVISNIATGETGVLLAEKLQRLGAKVTLVLGPVGVCCLNRKINLMRFRFFNELRDIINKELRSKRYDAVIHSAAVSDFKPGQVIKGKIDSKKSYNLRLLPLPKISRDIRRLASKAKMIIFKLESGVSDETLIKRAKATQAKVNADFIVANRLNPYRAFIIDRKDNIVAIKTKNALAKELLKIIISTINQSHFVSGVSG